MNANLRPYALVGGAALLGAIGASAARDFRKPDYYWYAVAQTDSIRALLNAHPGSRLKLEERTKDHIWISVMQGDSATRVVASFEVEESFPCPPLCR